MWMILLSSLGYNTVIRGTGPVEAARFLSFLDVAIGENSNDDAATSGTPFKNVAISSVTAPLVPARRPSPTIKSSLDPLDPRCCSVSSSLRSSRSPRRW